MSLASLVVLLKNNIH